MNFSELRLEAQLLLRRATIEQGTMALTEETENYRRIWSRDAMIAGLSALLLDDSQLIEGLKNSCLTLGRKQLETGAIPSNVSPDLLTVSYGSLAGRVDATTWWLVGSALYFNYSKDHAFLEEILPKVHKAFSVLNCWEFNDKHLIYTPLSGNWADEYPLHGYLLYDNLLRWWALNCWAEISEDKILWDKAEKVRTTIKTNFWVKASENENTYHPKLKFDKEQMYWLCGFHPGGLYPVFDAAANALSLMMFISDDEQKQSLEKYTETLISNLGLAYIPAFWPVIKEDSKDWEILTSNFAYQFKNRPYHFHNGGIWPVMMGLFCLGLKVNKLDHLSDRIAATYLEHANEFHASFHEYIDTQDFFPGGKKALSFSAAGSIFMSQNDSQAIIDKLKLPFQ